MPLSGILEQMIPDKHLFDYSEKGRTTLKLVCLTSSLWDQTAAASRGRKKLVGVPPQALEATGSNLT